MKIRVKNGLIISGIIVGALWISGCATPTPAPISKVIDISKDTKIDCTNCITGEQIEQIDLSHMLQNLSAVSNMEDFLKAYKKTIHSGIYGIDTTTHIGIYKIVTKENNTTYNINYINERRGDDRMSIFPISDSTIINVIMFPLHITSFFTEYMIRDVIFGPFEPISTISYTFDIAKLSDTQIKVSLNTNPTIKRTGAYHYIYPSYYDSYTVREAGVVVERDIKQTAKEDIEKIFNTFPSTINDKLREALYMNNAYINGANPFLEQAAYKAGKNYKASELVTMYEKCVSTLYDKFDTTLFNATKDIVKKIRADKKDLFVLNDNRYNEKAGLIGSRAGLIGSRNRQLKHIIDYKGKSDLIEWFENVRISKEDIARAIGKAQAQMQLGLKPDPIPREGETKRIKTMRIDPDRGKENFSYMARAFGYITDYEISEYGNDTLKEYVECGRIGKAIDLKIGSKDY